MAAKLFYAVIITFLVIFATIALHRAADRAKKLEEERCKDLLGPVTHGE